MSKKLGSLFAAVVVALFTVACAESDPGITTAVKTRLAADDAVKAYRIDVDTENGVVTLKGAVDSETARDRAVQLARNTDGVSNVVNQLTISPGATPTTGVDDRAQGEARETAHKVGDAASNAALTSAIKTKFLADDTISGLKIDVDSNHGVVTLTGTVKTAAEKNKALRVARETDGVTSVIDKLKVGK